MLAKTLVQRSSDAIHNLVPANVSHNGYLAIAKSRAKIMGVAMKHIPMPRPMLYTGEQATEELCASMVQAGHKHVLIVTDEILTKLGVIDRAVDYLKQNNVQYTVFDGVTPDPTYSVIEKGLDVSKKAGCDSVLAIGGGSVIDAAKMIALSQGSGRSPQKLVGLFKARKPSLPLYALPSTSGTGSEATIGAVVSDDVTHQKSIAIDPKMVPIATAVDPHVMKGMPPKVTADTGIDVLTHAIEAWVSLFNDHDSDYYAASATKNVFKYLPRAYADGNDLEAREAMGIAAHNAGIALNKCSLGYVHAIAHQLGAYHGIPHGRANAIVLPYVLEFNAKASEKRIAKLVKRIGTAKDPKASDEKIAAEFVQEVKDLITSLGIDPVVKGLDEKNFGAMAKAAAKEVSDTYAVPKYMTSDDIKGILRKIKAASEA
jgi:alcohol dehydrogenase